MGDTRTSTWVIELQQLGQPPDSPTFDQPQWSDDEITPVANGHGQSGESNRSRPRSSESQQPLPGASRSLAFSQGKDGRYRLKKPTKLRNSLLAVVGCLETANAFDFAANVWNMSPIPRYALALMAFGGIVALSMIYFCVKDCRLSIQNLRGLIIERRCLLAERQSHRGNPETLRTIDCFLDVNFRESGTEIVDRVMMDTLMGLSALFVSIGTWMAMDGDRHRHVYVTSNLLTGYVGNTPCALYGLSNVLWSLYVWIRASLQRNAAATHVRGTRVERMLQMRTSNLQMHAALNGLTGIVAGAAALATATMWWAYIVLAPCVVTSGLVNLFWRSRCGYDRPFMFLSDQVALIDVDTVIEALRHADSCRRMVWVSTTDAFTTLVHDRSTPADALAFIAKNGLFEDFCARILDDMEVSARIFSLCGNPESGTINWRSLASTDDALLVKRMGEICKALINDAAPKCFDYQERYLLEVLGCYMYRGGPRAIQKQKANKSRPSQSSQATQGPWCSQGQGAPKPPPHAHIHRGAYTDVGRHGNDWLFGGYSMTDGFKKLWKH